MTPIQSGYHKVSQSVQTCEDFLLPENHQYLGNERDLLGPNLCETLQDKK